VLRAQVRAHLIPKLVLPALVECPTIVALEIIEMVLLVSELELRTHKLVLHARAAQLANTLVVLVVLV